MPPVSGNNPTGTAQHIRLAGKDYVIVPRDVFEKLTREAAMPALPEPDADGNFPAVEYARASLARKIIRQRTVLGLSQKELAKLAGLPAETLCRIEHGRQTPTTASIVKIDRALQRAGRHADASTRDKRKVG